MKYLHKITINTLSKSKSVYHYQYGNTKEIEITITTKGISIGAYLTHKMPIDKMLKSDCYLFADAIKKCLLIYLIKYSKSLPIKCASIQIAEEQFCLSNMPEIYSMVEGSLITQMSTMWNTDTIINDILKIKKSYYGRRIASLFALIIAKSKKYESEKFIYLWMAFNGMYGYFANIIRKVNGKEIRKEYKQILCFQQLFRLGNATIEERDKQTIAQSVISVLAKLSDNEEINLLIKNCDSELYKKIEKLLVKSDSGQKYNLSPYGYLLTQLTYYFRCNIVHANKPTLLISFKDEKEIKCLYQLNTLLENYLDENLFMFFNKDYRDNYLKQKAKDIKL